MPTVAATNSKPFGSSILPTQGIKNMKLKLTRDEREMLELVGIIVAAVMVTPVAIFALAMLLSL